MSFGRKKLNPILIDTIFFIYQQIKFPNMIPVKFFFIFCLSRIFIKRTKMHNHQINEDSNSLSIGFAPLEMRVSKTKIVNNKTSELVFERIRHLEHRLVTAIMIITPFQLHSYSFRNQLKNYRFQKKSKSSTLFNEIQTVDEKQTQQIFATFKDLFSNWRTKINHKFFISFNNGDLAYFFHKPQDHDLKTDTKKGGSFALLSCKKSSYSTTLSEFQISYQNLQKTSLENERLLLRNNAIQLFWKYLTNLSMQKPANFQIISNFYYMNSTEALPLQNYNGKQQRPQFMHLAQQKVNFLGEVETELYSLRIQGFWSKENVEKMYLKLEEISEGKPFDIDFECHSGSENLYEQCQTL